MCYYYESITLLFLNKNDDLKYKEHKKATTRTQPMLFRIVMFVAVVFGFKNVFIILTVIAYYNRYIARYMEKIAATQYLSFDACAATSGNVSSMDFSHILECRLIYLSYKNCIKIRQIFLRYILCWEEVTVSFLEIKVTQ